MLIARHNRNEEITKEIITINHQGKHIKCVCRELIADSIA
jgi:hypothetical protein